jgi:sterol desaturase/sphingolipid hydroxylase (fatty acid hydroxylase superfamily)
MTNWLSIEMRLVFVVGLYILLILLEAIVPLFRFRERRLSRTLPNLGLTALVLLTNLALSFLAAWLSTFVVDRKIGLLFVVDVPEWAGILAGVILLDLCAYAAHVLLHKTEFGWRSHRVHHSEPEVDVTTALRQHPFESLWRITWQLPAIALLGLPMTTVLFYLVLSAANAQFEHANIRMNGWVDRLLRLVFVTPNMHKMHHSTYQPETDANYSNIFSFWDRFFRTYSDPKNVLSVRYGLDDCREKETLLSLLKMPLLTPIAASGSGPALPRESRELPRQSSPR